MVERNDYFYISKSWSLLFQIEGKTNSVVFIGLYTGT